MKNNIYFVWLESQEKAFKKIKNLIKETPTLTHFDYSKSIIVQANASGYGLGAALMQEIANEHREIVVYASRTLSPREQKYSQIEKKALALAFAAEHFKEYVRHKHHTWNRLQAAPSNIANESSRRVDS